MNTFTGQFITPMSPYFAVALTFLQKYYKIAGVGTLMSLALPYTVTILIGWFLFLLIWYYAGIPSAPARRWITSSRAFRLSTSPSGI